MLHSSEGGLSTAEAERRLLSYGANMFRHERRFTRIRRLFSQLKNPVVSILLISAVILYLINYTLDAYVVFAALIINLVVALLQEEKVSRAFELLRDARQSYAQVLRDGRKVELPAERLVPGDIVLFDAGNQVPADIRILEEHNLQINESALTGEWVPVHKQAITLVNRRDFADQANMVWKGTTIITGTGRGIVVHTGAQTAIGSIVTGLHAEGTKTPLYLQIQQMAQWIMILVMIAVLGIVAIGLLQGIPLVEIVITSIAIAIAGIPSGLPAAITVVLVIGMQAVLRHNGLVRNMLAAETLGSTTWILTDKTGTLTNGIMTLSEIITADTRERVDDRTISPLGRSIVLGAYLATDGKRLHREESEEADTVLTGSSIEQALVTACEDVCTVSPTRDRRIFYTPFESSKRCSSSIVREQGGGLRYYAVGAPEHILAESTMVQQNGRTVTLTTMQREKLKQALVAETEKGRRVIAVGSAQVAADMTDETDEHAYYQQVSESVHAVSFVAFLSLEDGIRADVSESVDYIRRAHVALTMVTGDNKYTALYVAKQCGIVADGDSEEVLLGDDIRGFSDTALFAKAQTVRVFARMLPDQKSHLLRVLLTNGEVVAMTGDGVNDAPALHHASIGIAVASGTDVAKESSDLILLKDSFSTITASIIEGRKIIQNLKKIVIYLFSTSFSEAILVAGGLLMSAALPITPVQILWANIVEEAFIAFAFAFERGDNVRYMRREKGDSIIGRDVQTGIIVLAMFTGAFLLVIYGLLSSFTSLTQEQLQTVMFIAVSVDSIFLAFSLRQLGKSVFTTNPFSNRWLTVAVAVSIVILILAFMVPPLTQALSLVPLPVWVYWIIPVSALFHVVIIEIVKAVFLRRRDLHPQERLTFSGTRR